MKDEKIEMAPLEEDETDGEYEDTDEDDALANVGGMLSDLIEAADAFVAAVEAILPGLKDSVNPKVVKVRELTPIFKKTAEEAQDVVNSYFDSDDEDDA
jgi:hypothetical protein